MEKKELTFQSHDGKTEVHTVILKPEGEIRGVVQITHGMVEYIERYRNFAEFLVKHGFLVSGMDLVGHGDSVASPDDWGYVDAEHPGAVWVSDMHTLKRITESWITRDKNIPYFMLGHSMGSYLVRMYMGHYGKRVDGVILTGTGYVDPKLTRIGLKLAGIESKIFGGRHHGRLITALSFGGAPYRMFDMTGKDYAHSWLTKDVDIVKQYYTDPRTTFQFTVKGYQGLFETVLYTCDDSYRNKLKQDVPVLIASGADDPVGDMGEGVRKVKKLLKNSGVSRVELKLYPGDRHEVLNETDREDVYDDILQWLEVRRKEKYNGKEETKQ